MPSSRARRPDLEARGRRGQHDRVAHALVGLDQRPGLGVQRAGDLLHPQALAELLHLVGRATLPRLQGQRHERREGLLVQRAAQADGQGPGGLARADLAPAQPLARRRPRPRSRRSRVPSKSKKAPISGPLRGAQDLGRQGVKLGHGHAPPRRAATLASVAATSPISSREGAPALGQLLAAGVDQVAVAGQLQGRGEQLARDGLGRRQPALQQHLLAHGHALGEEGVLVDRLARVARGQALGHDQVGVDERAQHAMGDQDARVSQQLARVGLARGRGRRTAISAASCSRNSDFSAKKNSCLSTSRRRSASSQASSSDAAPPHAASSMIARLTNQCGRGVAVEGGHVVAAGLDGVDRLGALVVDRHHLGLGQAAQGPAHAADACAAPPRPRRSAGRGPPT